MAILLNPKKPLSKPNQLFPVAPIRDGVVFPHVESVLTFGRSKSVAAVNEAFASTRRVVFVTQKNSQVSEPKKTDLYTIGILAEIERTLKTNDEINALVKGVSRVRLENIDDSGPFIRAEITEVPEIIDTSSEMEALGKHLLNEFKRAVNLGKAVEFLNFMKLMSGVSAPELADQIAATLDISTKEKQLLLEISDVKIRVQKIIEHLAHEIKVLEIEHTIANKTQKKFDKNMRENVLRERLHTIQKELGEESDEEQEVTDFKKKLKKINMPKDAKEKVNKELNRFAKLSIHSPEYSYIETWLETVFDLPWDIHSPNHTTLKKAEKVLNQDHYALEEVKERILEYLSVLMLKKAGKNIADRSVPTILCFVGPPGVGKTSIGRSIAKSLNRKFIKVSLGGIRDEAEIRGHRRTYVGAMPGRIIEGMIQAKTMNPVFMLDEIDKVGTDFRGDPTAALLEALDPEQNKEFSDHYLEIPFDLSEVIFITTANVLDTIPPALLDRLEIIEFTGYTAEEKFEIAKRHLVEKTRLSNGLQTNQISLPADTLDNIIKHYTKEAGVRNLEREISKLMRKVARKIAAKKTSKISIGAKDLNKLLGPERYLDTMAEKKPESGLATGLAWTQVGGDIIFIEVAVMPGKGHILLTGKLGEVMQESAKAAWSYVRTRWQELGLTKDFYKNIDIHVHVPEGAVPKDGPSAGITMCTALVSALTKKPIKTNLAMTGEITLRGRVLEIGGVKEKVIAAHRAGITSIILPKNNKKDTLKLPVSAKKAIKFYYVENVDQVLKIAFG
jgi:ATP-dependent Lon protease